MGTLGGAGKPAVWPGGAVLHRGSQKSQPLHKQEVKLHGSQGGRTTRRFVLVRCRPQELVERHGELARKRRVLPGKAAPWCPFPSKIVE